MTGVEAAGIPGIGECLISLGMCLVTKGKDVVSSQVNDAWVSIVRSFMEDCVRLLEQLSTFWMKVPDGNIGAKQGPMVVLNDRLAWLVGLASVLSIMLHCVRAVRQVSVRPFGEAMVQLALVVAVQLGLATAIQGLLAGSTALANDLLGATNGPRSLGGLIDVGKAFGSNPQAGIAVYLLLSVLAILGSLMQLLFMVLRPPLIMLLVVWLHLASATAVGEAGRTRVAKGFGLLTAFVIYKPAAAAIYSLGFMLIYGTGGVKSEDQFMNTIYGFAVVVMAAVALPALIRFIVPVAASATSSAFSGGAALGAIAAGSAIVATGGALAASGGGSAAAGMARGSSAARSGGAATAKGSTSASSGGAAKASEGSMAATGGSAAVATGGSAASSTSGGQGGGSAAMSAGGLAGGKSGGMNAIPVSSASNTSSGAGSSSTQTPTTSTGTGAGAGASSSRASSFGAGSGVSSSSSAPAGALKASGVNPEIPGQSSSAPPRPSSVSGPAAVSGGAGQRAASTYRPNPAPARRAATSHPGPGGPGRAARPQLPTWARAAQGAGALGNQAERVVPPGQQQ